MTPARHRVAAVILWTVLSACISSCARQAIFRLDVVLEPGGPGAIGERRFLVIEVSGPQSPAVWEQGDPFATQGLRVIDLAAGALPTPLAPFDIVSEREDRPVWVRVRYCPDRPDTAPCPSQGFRFIIDRPFHVGQVSYFRLEVPPVEDQGTRFAVTPEDPGVDSTRAYGATGFVCRCQVQCGQSQDDLRTGWCESSTDRCQPDDVPHACD